MRKYSLTLRLVSLPIPKGWHIETRPEGDMLRSDDGLWLMTPHLATAPRIVWYRAVLAAMVWLHHERAVKAQDEVKP